MTSLDDALLSSLYFRSDIMKLTGDIGCDCGQRKVYGRINIKSKFDGYGLTFYGFMVPVTEGGGN
jgi:hypothetical protein